MFVKSTATQGSITRAGVALKKNKIDVSFVYFIMVDINIGALYSLIYLFDYNSFFSLFKCIIPTELNSQLKYKRNN